ncbi:DUF5060 domain-containing protein [Pelomonas sp. Root1444]|uniref:DUF5060 domain-containing protein n=1 Tax=Pelomonas sp. Root1444 TaxID=1736464 RepID=UPI0007031A04|nr:DUF5060 domain-containing protein [Pelomonas sp. Root1444]KQY88991.1 alpha-L-rhamnosidase [Pelomonas sp. Root1444]
MRLWRALALLLALCGAAAQATGRATEQWGIHEIELKGPADGNPFVDVQLGARFSDGAQTVEVDGFYDGDGVYRVRFMPPRPGRWTWVTHSNRWPLTNKQGEFTATPPKPGNHGPVGVRHGHHFGHADGTPYKPVGTTMYSWAHRGPALEEQTLQTLAAAPFNKVRMLVFPQTAGTDRHPPPLWPCEASSGTPPRKWDCARFNPAFFRHLEQRVGQLRDLGIEADLILHHPYDDKREWGFDSMTREQDDRYARYLVARLAAYRNVWWSLANEFDFIRTKTDADWGHLGQLLQRIDPYNHLRSIHNGKRIYNQAEGWITHVSMQHGMAAAEASRAVLFREAWRKPVVFDELKYEGRHDRRWAQLTGQQMVQAFWAVTIAGSYGGHSEFIPDPADGTIWLAQGKALRGQSPPRIAFLKQILDTAPAEGIDPIDTFEDVFVAGQPGRYYLVYFGQQAPAEWLPRLYLTGLRDGQRFKAEVIDTWAMTITPVKESLQFSPQGRYDFVAKNPIKLPGKPGIALRLTALDAPAAPGAKPAVDD